jgi:maltooligosyltrehalose trehalohydrolase
MLFQGQEFAASTPFLYFADHEPNLSPLVASGRKLFLSQFNSIASEETCSHLAPPDAIESFSRCKLDFSERKKNGAMYELHRDLLQGAVLGPEAFVVRFFSETEKDRLIFINLGRDLLLATAPEPLLANPEGCNWRLIWSSESPRYGGAGTPQVETEQGWRVPGHAAIVFAAQLEGYGEASSPD